MRKKNEEIRKGLAGNSNHIQADLRSELIRRIESGTPRSVIAYEYGISRAALGKWMRNYGSEEYHSRQRSTHLTEVEKRSIVRLIEQGSLTPHAAREAYGISGPTLNKLLKASMQENTDLAVHESLEMKDDQALQPGLPDAEKEALKKALAEAQMKISALNTLIDVAEDQFKITIRKKAGARQSKS